MIKHWGDKMTAKELAQKLICDRIHLALDYWYEDDSIDMDEITEKENEAIKDQMYKVAKRALKPCGWDLDG